MEALLAVVQEVELVSDQSWWSENASSVLLAVAAIGAAFLAAWVANRNHKRQLAHDRDLQNQDHIREVIDAASLSATDAHAALGDYVFSEGGTEEWRSDLFNDAQGKINAIKNLTYRLKIRLGEDSEIAKKHDAICDELQNLLDDEVKQRGGDRAGESSGSLADDDAEVARWAPIRVTFREFREQCYARFNEQPKPSLSEKFRTIRHSWAGKVRTVR